MKRVLVLGATGFVGSRLVERLRQADWAIPVAAVRSQAGRPSPAQGVESRTWQATDPGSLKGALSGIDCIVNCVAGTPAAMVGSARQVFAAALTAPIERVVHLSSMAVYGGATGTVDEEFPLAAEGDYAEAKLTGETLARDFARHGGRVVILRPSCIYGLGSEQWTGRIGRLLRARRLGDLGPDGDGLCNLIFIDDMVGAIVEALRRPGIDGEAFNVSNRDPESWNRYFVRFALALGATPVLRIGSPRLKLETKVLAAPLKLAELAARRSGLGAGRLPEPIPPSLARLWRQEIRLDNRKSDALLGFARTPLHDGIAAAARWLGAATGARSSYGDRSHSFLR